MGGAQEKNGLAREPHISILEPPAGWRDRELSLGSEGTVCLVLNKVLKVTEEE